MNSTELKGNWEEQKGKLKQKFAALTENDLLFKEGMKDEMIGKLQIKLGKTKEELLKIIEKQVVYYLLLTLPFLSFYPFSFNSNPLENFP